MKKKLVYVALAAVLALPTMANATFGPGAHVPDLGRQVGLCENFDNWGSPRTVGTPYWRPCCGFDGTLWQNSDDLLEYQHPAMESAITREKRIAWSAC